MTIRLLVLLLGFSCLNVVNCAADESEIDEDDFIDERELNDGGGSNSYIISPIGLTNLARSEMEIYKQMGILLNGLDTRRKMIKDYMKDYEESSMIGTRNVSDDKDGWKKAVAVAAHPFMVYRMIRRFSKDIEKIQNHVANDLEADFLETLSRIQGDVKWPNIYDLGDAITSIFRLQSVYDMDIKKLAQTSLSDFYTRVGLTADHCYEIAKFALQFDYFTLALDWLKITIGKIQSGDEETLTGDKEEDLKKVKDKINYVINKHDVKWETYKEMSSTAYIYATRITESDPNLPLKKMIDIEKKDPARKLNLTLDNSHVNYMTLCNGESLQPEKIKAKLYCWNEHKKHPYWTINPLKMELLNKNPPLVQIYEFIGDKFIKDLTHMAVPRLDPPPEPRDENDHPTPRRAMYAWLSDKLYPTLEPFIRRIEFITGLKAYGDRASTALQVASYAFGGYVATHWDSYGTDEDPRGDRVLTALFYMNSVAKGGYTAFPLLGTVVKPEKGAAVLWYTSLKNGEVDRRMYHGACPVILGDKWIATKWIHLKENFRTFPCSLNPKE